VFYMNRAHKRLLSQPGRQINTGFECVHPVITSTARAGFLVENKFVAPQFVFFNIFLVIV